MSVFLSKTVPVLFELAPRLVVKHDVTTVRCLLILLSFPVSPKLPLLYSNKFCG